MTKVLGSLVGAKVASTGFPGINNFNKDCNARLIVRDQAVMTAANLIGDTIQLGFIKSGSYLDPLSWAWWDAFGASVTMNIGDATYPSGLASALAIAAAGNAAVWKAFSAVKMSQPLWQALGYAADPGTNIEILGTIAGANVSNTANMAWQIHGIQR
jgi:hypothetical protein